MIASLPRAYVGVRGTGAADYLQRMVSNDIEGLPVGGACEALLLTAKARVIALLTVVRRADDDFLLVTEPELGDVVREHLTRVRFAARADIQAEEHSSVVVLGQLEPPAGVLAISTSAYGIPGVELVDGTAPEDARAIGEDELEALRIRAGTARVGRDVDDRVLPAEAGLVERAVDFHKGCYPGQEPIARLHYRGHANRGLRVLALEGEPPARDTDVVLDGKNVGRVTSAVRNNGRVVALAYVRSEVPVDAVLEVGGAEARPLD